MNSEQLDHSDVAKMSISTPMVVDEVDLVVEIDVYANGEFEYLVPDCIQTDREYVQQVHITRGIGNAVLKSSIDDEVHLYLEREGMEFG